MSLNKKNEAELFFLKILDYQHTDAKEKNNDFLVEHSSTSVMFSIEISIEETELVVGENYSSNVERNQIKWHFLGKLN